jgi:hypothetical protein
MSKDEKTDDKDRSITIVVNAQQKTVIAKELTFDQIADLADPNRPTGPNVDVTITFYRGHGDKKEGALHPGESVKVKDGMVFDVRITDKS